MRVNIEMVSDIVAASRTVSGQMPFKTISIALKTFIHAHIMEYCGQLRQHRQLFRLVSISAWINAHINGRQVFVFRAQANCNVSVLSYRLYHL